MIGDPINLALKPSITIRLSLDPTVIFDCQFEQKIGSDSGDISKRPKKYLFFFQVLCTHRSIRAPDGDRVQRYTSIILLACNYDYANNHYNTTSFAIK